MRTSEIVAGTIYEGGARLMRRKVLAVGKGVYPLMPDSAHVLYKDVGAMKGPFYLPLKSFAEWARRVAASQDVPAETPITERRYVAEQVGPREVRVLDRKYNNAVAATVVLRENSVRGRGWVLFPNNAARNPSRKFHETAAQAIASMRYMKLREAESDLSAEIG